MITREQAEQTFNEQIAPVHIKLGYTLRNVLFQQADGISDEYYWQNDDAWPTGDLAIETPCWEVIYELVKGDTTRKRIAYIVEPKPGIYFFY